MQFVAADDVVGVVERPANLPNRMVAEAAQRTAEARAGNPDFRLGREVFVSQKRTKFRNVPAGVAMIRHAKGVAFFAEFGRMPARHVKTDDKGPLDNFGWKLLRKGAVSDKNDFFVRIHCTRDCREATEVTCVLRKSLLERT